MKKIDRGINGQNFQQFLEEELAPKSWSGAVVVMDNLPAYKVQGVTSIIEDAGARVIYLSPCSPELNPIEHLWSQLKSFLRKLSKEACGRKVRKGKSCFSPQAQEAVSKLLEIALMLSHPEHFRNWFTHCYYCTSLLCNSQYLLINFSMSSRMRYIILI
ncbi:MAG: transposase [Cyanobacteria bacterium P01_E01_bin.35]